jgi:hypothetical protein
MTKRTHEDYEELQRLMDEAKEAVSRVQAILMGMLPVLGRDNRQLPTSYDEKALEIFLALEQLSSELDLERRHDVGDSEGGPSEEGPS